MVRRPSSDFHFVRTENVYRPPFPGHLKVAVFAAGCYWGTEKAFWRLPGVYSTAVGFIGGHMANPSYRQACSGTTGHTECTQVVYDPALISFADLLLLFWRCHDPTQGNRQGNDRGTQYRSGVYTNNAADYEMAIASRDAFQAALKSRGRGRITSEIPDPTKMKQVQRTFWYAEEYHQQYLAKPGARPYCSAEPTGVPVPTTFADEAAFKLPVKFWNSYNFSIRTSDRPVELSKDAMAKADLERAQKLQAHALQTQALEAECDVIVRYCGGCGFKAKAEQLGAVMERLLGENGIEVEVGLLADVEVTGAFEVRVKRDEVWETVHSDGFVESREALLAVLLAIADAHGFDGGAEVEGLKGGCAQVAF